jgi:tetratricopeptide (TPR) repeat protein
MKHISESELNRLHELSYANPLEALRLLTEYERKYPADPNLSNNNGALLIDIGSALSDISVIERGINQIEKRRTTNKGVLSPVQWYNLANGYYAAEAVKRGPNYTYDPTKTTLVDAKKCYREAFNGSEKMDKYWRAQLHINYANTLAQLGRSVESIGEYNRALQLARHPMAFGNLGIEFQKFSRISRDPTLLEEALGLLNQAVNDPELKNSGHEHALAAFVQSQRQIE